tara:strand:+ start:1106 stop:1300 length:195 start_codon:yes stop_codon:yes gene_type:complete
LKPIKTKPRPLNYVLKSLNIKEIMDKYPDKVVEVYNEGKHAILQLSNMRIKFINRKKGKSNEKR